MRQWGAAAALCLVMTCSPASAAVYKCTVNGKTTYQDRPCAGSTAEEHQVQIRSAAPSAPTPAPASSATDAAPPATQSTSDTFLARRELINQRNDLQSQIDKLERENTELRQQLDAELAQLKLKQSQAANNLAGAQYMTGISTEMQAVTDRYQSQMNANEARLRDLRQQLASMPRP